MIVINNFSFLKLFLSEAFGRCEGIMDRKMVGKVLCGSDALALNGYLKDGLSSRTLFYRLRKRHLIFHLASYRTTTANGIHPIYQLTKPLSLSNPPRNCLSGFTTLPWSTVNLMIPSQSSGLTLASQIHWPPSPFTFSAPTSCPSDFAPPTHCCRR